MWNAFLQGWSWLLVAVLIYIGGQVSKAVAAKKGWRSKPDATAQERTWYDITLPFHPIVVGALLGLIPWPTLHVIEEMPIWEQLAARVGWFTLAGTFCGQTYETINNIVSSIDDIVLDRLRTLFGVTKKDGEGGGES